MLIDTILGRVCLTNSQIVKFWWTGFLSHLCHLQRYGSRFSATWSPWKALFLELEPGCNPFSGSWRVIGLSQKMIKQCQSPLWRTSIPVSNVDTGEMEFWRPSQRASFISLSVYYWILHWLRCRSKGINCHGDMVSTEKEMSYKHFRDEGSTAGVIHLPRQGDGRVLVVDEWQCHSDGVLEETKGAVFLTICRLVQITTWSELYMASISAWYILEKKNIPAGQLNCLDQVLPTEWSLPWVCNTCLNFGHPPVDLFATGANMKLPIYVSPILDPKA